jgi:hypothetical protein
MPKTSLGVQMTPHGMCAVRLKGGWKRTAVDHVFRVERRPPASTDPVQTSAFGPADTVVSAISSDRVFHREFELPFSDAKKLGQAAPLEAEESLPLPLEELVCDVQILEKRPGGSKVMVVASPAERVEGLLSDLKLEGVFPVILDVEALALATVARRALGGEESAVIVDVAPHICQAVFLSGGIARTFHVFASAAADPALLEELSAFLKRHETESPPINVYLSGPALAAVDEQAWSQELAVPVRRLPFARVGIDATAENLNTWPAWAIPLGLALRGTGGRCASQVNLLRGEFALSKGSPPWRQTAIAVAGYGAVLSALWCATVWMEASQLENRRQTLERNIRKTFQEAMPEVRNIVNEVEQLKTRVAVLEEQDRAWAGLADPESSPLRVLRNISAKIPKDTEVEIRDLAIDSEKVRIEGSTTSYRTSERFKTEIMAASPRFTTASSDAKDGTKPGEVLFTLSVNLGVKR